MTARILAAGLLATGLIGCGPLSFSTVIYIDPAMAEEYRGAAAEAVLEWAEIGADIHAEIGTSPCGRCVLGDEVHHVQAVCDDAIPGGGQYNPGGVVVACARMDDYLGPGTAHDVFLHELGHVLGLGAPAGPDGHMDPTTYPGDVMNGWIEQVEGGGPSFRAAVPYSSLSAADLAAFRAWHP